MEINKSCFDHYEKFVKDFGKFKTHPTSEWAKVVIQDLELLKNDLKRI